METFQNHQKITFYAKDILEKSTFSLLHMKKFRIKEMFPDFKSSKSGKINGKMFIIIDTFTQYFTNFYFQNLKKNRNIY